MAYSFDTYHQDTVRENYDTMSDGVWPWPSDLPRPSMSRPKATFDSIIPSVYYGDLQPRSLNTMHLPVPTSTQCSHVQGISLQSAAAFPPPTGYFDCSVATLTQSTFFDPHETESTNAFTPLPGNHPVTGEFVPPRHIFDGRQTSLPSSSNRHSTECSRHPVSYAFADWSSPEDKQRKIVSVPTLGEDWVGTSTSSGSLRPGAPRENT